MSDTKTTATDYSARKEKEQKECILEDPDSDPKLSELLLNDSDFPDDSNCERRRSDKKKKYRKCKKQDPIKLCAKLTAKLPTTAYKSKVLKLKFDKDPLHHRIYYLTFMVSLKIFFHISRKIATYLCIILI